MLQKTPPKLSNIHILIADGDLYMSGMLAHMLHTMGFTRVTRVSNGQRAVETLEKDDIDVLLTEWSMDGVDGIKLAQYMRDQHRSPNLMMPIIMITGRAERENVEVARDTGITEFVVKPFSSAMLFDRIRRIFDQPRDFVLSGYYTGPDRRHTAKIPKKPDLRTATPSVISHIGSGVDCRSGPVIVTRDFGLKRKANVSGSIENIITPGLLQKAQDVISSYAEQSDSWIGVDIANLERSINRLVGDLPGALQQAQNSALSIKSRAGMFGYDMASNVSFALYSFLYHDFSAQQVNHIVILKKHLEVLKVLLAGRSLGHTPEVEQELTSELLRMTAKLKAMDEPSDELKTFMDSASLPELKDPKTQAGTSTQ